jgi:sugar lactone lactonase YvrE
MATSTYTAELALEVRAELGEGPVWDDRSQDLYFVDIEGRRVHAFHPIGRRHRSFEVDRMVGAVVLRDDGGLLLAAEDSFLSAAIDGSTITPYCDFTTGDNRVRFNDGKVDPKGRFLAGTMDRQGDDRICHLYMLHPNGTTTVLLDDIGCSNGLDWTSDGSVFYYIDTSRHTIDAFDVDPSTGGLSGRKLIAEIRDGSPDGMAIDDEGLLWVAVWGAARVDRIDPSSGQRIATIEVPTALVSSVAFGGPSRRDLYITTARAELDEAASDGQPNAGDLFVAHLDVAGPLPHRFGSGSSTVA